jgi:hypothetical protein
MELLLTPEQAKHLDKTSPLKAATLQRIFKKSVQDQQKTLQAAAKIRAKKTK